MLLSVLIAFPRVISLRALAADRIQKVDTILLRRDEIAIVPATFERPITQSGQEVVATVEKHSGEVPTDLNCVASGRNRQQFKQ